MTIVLAVVRNPLGRIPEDGGVESGVLAFVRLLASLGDLPIPLQLPGFHFTAHILYWSFVASKSA